MKHTVKNVKSLNESHLYTKLFTLIVEM